MCIRSPHWSLLTAIPPGCHPNGGGWQIINRGAVGRTHASVIARCTTCGAEWSLCATARKTGVLGPPTERSNGRRRTSADVDLACELAGQLIANGATVASACRTAGIDRKVYYRRIDGTTRVRRED